MTNHLNTIIQTSLLVAFAGIANAADVTGEWTSKFESLVGPLHYTYDLQADGTNLTGTVIRRVDGEATTTPVLEGAVDGERVVFVEVLIYQGADIRIEYDGKLSGDEIQFTRQVGDFATMETVAHREQASVAGRWQAEFDTGIGVQKYIFEFKVEGEMLTGQADAEIADEQFSTQLTEGKVKADKITFVEPMVFQDVELRIEYTGQLSGDEIQFTREVGDVATEELTAKRMKE